MGFILSSEHLYEQPKEIPEPFVLSHWIISEPPGSEKKQWEGDNFPVRTGIRSACH